MDLVGFHLAGIQLFNGGQFPDLTFRSLEAAEIELYGIEKILEQESPT